MGNGQFHVVACAALAKAAVVMPRSKAPIVDFDIVHFSQVLVVFTSRRYARLCACGAVANSTARDVHVRRPVTQ
jgi:hypothetical protein